METYFDMKICVVLLLSVVCCVRTTHLNVGNTATAILEHEKHLEYNSFPFMKRVKQYFYTQEDNRKILGIQALDNLHSKASVNITAGGVGHSYVNLRFKSERGLGLDYNIGIYVEPKHNF